MQILTFGCAAPPPLLVLASASVRRVALLTQVGITPDLLCPADVDETPRRWELPRHLVYRIARAKALSARTQLCQKDPTLNTALILSADTIVAVGRRILPEPKTEEEAELCLRLLSGHAHRVYTCVCVSPKSEKIHHRIVETRVRFKRLTQSEITAYLATKEWQGKAGGYAIQGLAGAFVLDLSGSYSNVVGLPLYETLALLQGSGFPILKGWTADRPPPSDLPV